MWKLLYCNLALESRLQLIQPNDRILTRFDDAKNRAAVGFDWLWIQIFGQVAQLMIPYVLAHSVQGHDVSTCTCTHHAVGNQRTRLDHDFHDYYAIKRITFLSGNSVRGTFYFNPIFVLGWCGTGAL